MNNFNHDKGREYCKSLGLFWDKQFAEQVDGCMHDFEMSQDCWDILVKLHSNRVLQMFTPSYYPWRMRIMIALRFLNPFSKPKELN